MAIRLDDRSGTTKQFLERTSDHNPAPTHDANMSAL